MESLSRWQKLKANKMPSVEVRAERTAQGAGMVSACFKLFMIGLQVFQGNKKPCYLFGSRAEENRYKLFSFAPLVGRPCQGVAQGLNSKCGYEATRNNGNHGGADGETDGIFQHHLVACQHGGRNVHSNDGMSNGGNV